MSTSSGDWTTLVPVTGEAVALDLLLRRGVLVVVAPAEPALHLVRDVVEPTHR